MNAVVDENKKYQGISEFRDVEILPAKQPPYTDQDIEQMLVAVKDSRIVCSSAVCYSMSGGANGTACGSCCSGG